MDFERRRLHERHQAVEVANADQRFRLRRVFDEDDGAVDSFPGVLLEEGLSADPIRAADQRQRAARDEGFYQRPGLGVIVGQALLGDAGVGPIDAIGMGQRDAARRTFRRGVCGHGRLADNLVRRLVVAQALKGRLAHEAVGGPAAEIDFRHQLRPNEANATGLVGAEADGERA